MQNPKYLNLHNPETLETIEYDMENVDRITVAPAREVMSHTARELKKIDALDLVVRVQFKGESSKEYSLRQYNMEFIYP